MSAIAISRQLLTVRAIRCLPLLAAARIPGNAANRRRRPVAGAIANPQVPRLDLPAVADGDTVFYHGTVGKFEIRLTLMREGDSVSDLINMQPRTLNSTCTVTLFQVES